MAISIAKKLNGIIINADALQVYGQLPIITASPTAQDKKKVEHYLYNHVDVCEEYCVARYLEEATNTIFNLPKDKLPIIVGGTGLYVNSLIYGMHQIPNINPELRQNIRNEAKEKGAGAIYDKLQKVDPISASKLNILDVKRICRAYEVFMETGTTITEFYKEENFYKPLESYNITTFLLMPERKLLYQNCDARFDSFFEQGVINECKKLLECWGELTGTAKKALGLEEIINYLKGITSLPEAIELGKQRTRNFAKRQITWFKNQLKGHHVIPFNNNDGYTMGLDTIYEILDKAIIKT
jgi:tRNA dimethylallyltransferase